MEDNASGNHADRELPHEITVTSVVEAVLFASDEPLTAAKLTEIVGTGTPKDIHAHIDELNRRYQTQGHAYRIEQIAGGYQILTLPEYGTWVSKLVTKRGEHKLSQAALETLAVVAYRQPVMRAAIESIRGVAAGEMVRNLMEKGLVKIVGRAEEIGRPLLYGTTRRFLEIFGLNSLKDLPKVEELPRPAAPAATGTAQADRIKAAVHLADAPPESDETPPADAPTAAASADAPEPTLGETGAQPDLKIVQPDQESDNDTPDFNDQADAQGNAHAGDPEGTLDASHQSQEGPQHDPTADGRGEAGPEARIVDATETPDEQQQDPNR